MSRDIDDSEINDVLTYQRRLLSEIKFPEPEQVEERIVTSERLLKDLGYSPSRNVRASESIQTPAQPVAEPPSWDALVAEAQESVGTGNSLESLFTEEELRENSRVIRRLNEEFNQIHRLDSCDVAIAAVAGILGAAVDILLTGIPEKTPTGIKAGPLSNYIRDGFDRAFPRREMEQLASSKASKVPFDAQDNRNTAIYVEGLSAYYHRLLSLGHDPLLGFFVGVSDIMSGKMTTIDKTGKIVSQVMENYADRTEQSVFAAIAKELAHLKSDVTTSMGLPAPLMGLFNLVQVGSILEYDQTVAEIVQGMYFQGYDFIHFCSQSASVAVIEVAVRIGYALKRISEGAAAHDAIPFSSNPSKLPKLGTMLFMAHSAATAINAGKIYLTENPLAINYSQWLVFACYSYRQLKWSIVTKPALRERYVRASTEGDLATTLAEVDKLFDSVRAGEIVI